jgi:hypothetical protein
VLYQFSRAMYRALAPWILPPASAKPHENDRSNHVRVLRACEATLERMATDRYYFARPARSLIRDLRPYFPLSQQAYMQSVVEHYLALADEALRQQFATGYDFAGNRLCCRAMTRKSTPCQRLPDPRNGYCPSHQHLADADANVLEPALAA